MKPESADRSSACEVAPPRSQFDGRAWAPAQVTLLLVVAVLGPLWGGQWDERLSVSSGRILLALSAGMALAGAIALGRNLTPHPKPRREGKLVTRGVYAVVRHPLYASLILGSIGWSLQWGSLPALIVSFILAVVLDRKARVEEEFLIERYPEYADYARRVGRFFPGIR